MRRETSCSGMGRASVGLVVLMALAACSGGAGGAGDVAMGGDTGPPPADAGGGVPDLGAAPDTAGAPDLHTTDAGGAPDLALSDAIGWTDLTFPDVGTFEDLGPLPDTGDELVLLPEPHTSECRTWGDMVGGHLGIGLRWRTTRPATCTVWRLREEGDDWAVWPAEDDPSRDHVLETSVHYMEDAQGGPEVGAEIRWEARCIDAAHGQEVVSEPWTHVIDQADRDCIWPYDDGCSDGSMLICRAGLALCPVGQVPAVLDGCHRCVYPATCGCGDGTSLRCASPRPECSAGAEVAVRDGCHVCVNPFNCLPTSSEPCPDYVGAQADCAFQYYRSGWDATACRAARCLAGGPCRADADCEAVGSLDSGAFCVAGSCVDCWEDPQCGPGELCRTGRCVAAQPEGCVPAPDCTDEGCRLLAPSEVACPVCVCASEVPIACREDAECHVLSRYPYAACVNGRCAQCRNDDDCATGRCAPPGVCLSAPGHASRLYGTWLLGWLTALNHVSFVRFEPDGTLRRGTYEPDEASADDFPPLPCLPEGVLPLPLVGTWEPIERSDARLAIRMALNLPCDAEGDGWSGRFLVTLPDPAAGGWAGARFEDIDGDRDFEGYRADHAVCRSDFSFCELY